MPHLIFNKIIHQLTNSNIEKVNLPEKLKIKIQELL